ncbi:MAG TPA: aerotolerance regulator BatA, partial [Acidobacteriota bacterium]
MFRLGAKIYLLLWLLLPLLAWWEKLLDRRGQRHVWFPARDLLPAYDPTLKAALIRRLNLFKLAALFLFITALARPQFLNTDHVEEQKGMDILLTLDISGSMAAVDFKPKN